MKNCGFKSLAFAAALLLVGWAKPASALTFTYVYDPAFQSYWTPAVKAQIEEAGKFLASYIANSHSVEITCVVNPQLGSGTFATGAPNAWLENSASKSIASKGSIAFNPNSLSNVNQSSIVALTIHELMHCLGVGASASFQAKVSAGKFTGAKTTALNGGTQAKLGGGNAHFYQRDKDPKGAIPRISEWGGDLMSCLDLGILADVGYDVPSVASGQPMFVPVTINKMYAMNGDIYIAMGGNDVIYAGAGPSQAMMAGLGGDDVLVTGGSIAKMFGDNGGGNEMGDAGADIFYIKTNFEHEIYGYESRDKIYFDPSLGFTQAQVDSAPMVETGYMMPQQDGTMLNQYELEIGTNFKMAIWAPSMPGKTNMKVQSWSK